MKLKQLKELITQIILTDRMVDRFNKLSLEYIKKIQKQLNQMLTNKFKYHYSNLNKGYHGINVLDYQCMHDYLYLVHGLQYEDAAQPYIQLFDDYIQYQSIFKFTQENYTNLKDINMIVKQ